MPVNASLSAFGIWCVCQVVTHDLSEKSAVSRRFCSLTAFHCDHIGLDAESESPTPLNLTGHEDRQGTRTSITISEVSSKDIHPFSIYVKERIVGSISYNLSRSVGDSVTRVFLPDEHEPLHLTVACHIVLLICPASGQP
jgi:hypothetical protein